MSSHAIATSASAAIPRERFIASKAKTPPPAPGFAGPGHTAVEVVAPYTFGTSNPFPLLMDDRLAFDVCQAVGGPHPHAGLETVTFLLEGSIHDREEGILSAGDAAWMTAGRGVIHNENVVAMGEARILQLWIALPKSGREFEPRLQILPRDSVPIRREAGAEARIYSGQSGDVVSPTKNHLPVTMVDFTLEPHAAIEQELPWTYGGFVYVLSGSVRIGDTVIEAGDVGWLDASSSAPSMTSLRLVGGEQGGRVLLYAGQRLDERIVMRGPFVAASETEIARFHREYRAGLFTPLSQVVG